MNDWEREFSFCKVFAETFEGGVAGCRGEVEVVIKDLKEEADRGDEGCTVAVERLVMKLKRKKVYNVHVHRTLGLHKFDSQPEETTRLVTYHFQVVCLAGAC